MDLPLYFPFNRQCGRRPSQRGKRSASWQSAIVNGAEAEPNSWPWMVSLRNRANGQHFCGGSIIDETWIITAAHCLRDGADELRPENIKIVAGDHVITTIQASEREYLPRRFLLHKEFDNITLDNDIALIELTEAIVYNDAIAPVCLPNGPPPIGQICTTTGWGWTLKTGDRTRLNELHPSILSNEKCGSVDYWGDHVTPNMVCAGFQGHGAGHGVCRGDSGGPLACNNNGNSPYSLVGIVSWTANRCKNPDGTKPSVFSKVYNYHDWIQNSIAKCHGYFLSDDGHCYKYVEHAMNYSEAEKFCRSEGSYLAEIESEKEQYFLQVLVGYNYVWIGLQDKYHNGNWDYWNSGSPMLYSNWGEGEPNNFKGKQYCGRLWNQGKWDDENCESDQKFVCEHGSNQAVQKSRKFYTYHKEKKNYADAQISCASEGGYLVEINSEYEQLFLEGWAHDDQIWIGLSDRQREGNWTNWNSGEPITYSYWRKREPDNKDPNANAQEHCAEMTVQGMWNDLNCDWKMGFICEDSSNTKPNRNIQIMNEKSRYICSDDGHCYKYVEHAMHYPDAEHYCHSEGSYLVEIGSEIEQYFLQGLLGYSYHRYVWIGLKIDPYPGNWDHWNSGAPVSYSNWLYGAPYHITGSQFCGELRYDGLWTNEHGCEQYQKFVCERGSIQASRKQRKCYSYHKVKKNYDDALDTCASERGYLVEIGTQWEQLVVHELAQDNNIWLGFNDKQEGGNWTKWNSGAPVVYSNWTEGEPDNENQYIIHCGEMRSSGKWYDTKCDKGLRFICEDSHRTKSNRHVKILCNDSGY